MKIYVSENRILLFLLSSAFTYTFLYFPFLGWTLYSAGNALCKMIVCIYAAGNLGQVLNFKKYRPVNLLACVYFLTVLVSKICAGSFSASVLMTFLFQCAFFPFIELQREKGHIRFLYKTILFWFGTGLVFNDLLMVIMPGRFFGDGFSRNFLLGNKFNVAYDHMVFLIIFCLLFSKSAQFRKWMGCLFVFTCLVCQYIDCKTAVVGTLVFLTVYLSPKPLYERLSSRPLVFTAIALCVVFVFSIQITQIPSVRLFITEVLGRDVTLTGRKMIYSILPKVIRRKPWLGYGSSGGIISRYTGAYDAQNGFFELVVCNGIPSAVLFVTLLLSLIRKSSGRPGRILLGGIYAYLVMSTVEVTFGTTLLLFGILLLSETKYYTENRVRILDWGTSVSVHLS